MTNQEQDAARRAAEAAARVIEMWKRGDTDDPEQIVAQAIDAEVARRTAALREALERELWSELRVPRPRGSLLSSYSEGRENGLKFGLAALGGASGEASGTTKEHSDAV